MNYGALSLSQTPPLGVPTRFMVTAPWAAVLAAIILFIHPEQLANRWSPAMLAATHLVTLGFISMTMVGALQQLLPVLVGVRLASPDLVSRLLYGGMVAGTVALAAGFLFETRALLAAGGLILALTILTLAAVFLSKLVATSAGVDVTRGMIVALVALLITAALGIYLLAGYVVPQMTVARPLAGLHVAFGLFGWVAIMVMTVSYQVVPMFQITPKYPRPMVRLLGLATFFVLTALAAAELAGSRGLRLAAGLGLLGCLVGHAVVTLVLQARRRRKLPDVTLDFWRLGMASLVVGSGCWLADAVAPAGSMRFEVALAVLMFVGFAVSLINGMLYKIIPFLVWLHLTNRVDMHQRWQHMVPNMKQIIPDRRARAQLVIHVLALSLLLVAPWGGPLMTRVACVAFAASNLLLAWNLVQGLRVFGRARAAMGADV